MAKPTYPTPTTTTEREDYEAKGQNRLPFPLQPATSADVAAALVGQIERAEAAEAEQDRYDQAVQYGRIVHPHFGVIQVVVETLPLCQMCDTVERDPPNPGRFDARTTRGPWAFLCQPCWLAHSVGVLGTGRGQRLVTVDEAIALDAFGIPSGVFPGAGGEE